MDEMLLMLITSFYLNLSWNPENTKILLDLNIFEKLARMKDILFGNE